MVPAPETGWIVGPRFSCFGRDATPVPCFGRHRRGFGGAPPAYSGERRKGRGSPASGRSAGPRPRHLPGGGVEAVPEVDRGDREDQGCERRFVVVPGCLLP